MHAPQHGAGVEQVVRPGAARHRRQRPVPGSGAARGGAPRRRRSTSAGGRPGRSAAGRRTPGGSRRTAIRRPRRARRARGSSAAGGTTGSRCRCPSPPSRRRPRPGGRGCEAGTRRRGEDATSAALRGTSVPRGRSPAARDQGGRSACRCRSSCRDRGANAARTSRPRQWPRPIRRDSRRCRRVANAVGAGDSEWGRMVVLLQVQRVGCLLFARETCSIPRRNAPLPHPDARRYQPE